MSDQQHVLFSTDGPIGRLELNRPEARNAQNRAMLVELERLLHEINAREDVRVVILSGRGPTFSAGHDLKEAQTRSHFTVEQRFEYEYRLYFGLCLKLMRLRQPTIAQVQGHCIAAGFMLAAMCDLVVAAEDAVFADPVVHKLGAAAVEVLFHPWVLNPRLARDLLLTGRSMSADEAHRVGFVSRVVPVDRLQEETLAVAQRIAAAPPFAAQLVKRAINRTLDIQGLSNSLEAHFDTHMLTHYTHEWSQVNGGNIADAIKREVGS